MYLWHLFDVRPITFSPTPFTLFFTFNQFGIHLNAENLWKEYLWQWTCQINWLSFLLDMVNKGVSANQQIYWQHILLGKIARLILKSELWNSFSFRHFAQHKYVRTYIYTKYNVLRKLLFWVWQPCTVKGKSCKIFSLLIFKWFIFWSMLFYISIIYVIQARCGT